MNRTIKFHAFATTALATRRTYSIQGHKGLLVIERSLFADGDGPEELTLDVDLVEPKIKEPKPGVAEKAAAALAKAQEKAEKAATKAAAQVAKAQERAAKAQAIIDAAAAKTAAAQQS